MDDRRLAALKQAQHPIQALALYASNESLEDTIQMGRHREHLDRLDPRNLQDLPELLRKQRITVMDQIFL
jgi:hypothetical protein